MAEDYISSIKQEDVSFEGIEFKKPTIIRDTCVYSAYFPASVEKIRRLLPGTSFSPAQLFPGIGLVQVTAYDHRDSDFGPYSDFSVVIPLYSPRFRKIPLYNIKRAISANELHLFMLHRAATSETAVRVARDYFQWPMFQASIEFTEDDDWLSCEVREEADLICCLRGPKIPTQRGELAKVFVHTPQHQQSQRAEINFREVGSIRKPKEVELELGSSHPIARELSETLKSMNPSIYTYALGQSVGYGPE